MFNGVGIPSAKGTGTNGYVERALGYLPKDYKPGSYGEIIRQMKSNPAPNKRKINDEIILHEEKHKIEVELYDLKEKYLTEKKYSDKEIEEKINKERRRLYYLLERREADFMDKNETHQKGKLKDAQMKIIKDALKIKDGYYLGEGFEYGLQADMDKMKKSKKEHKSKKDKKKISKHHKDEHKYNRKHDLRKDDDEKYSNDYPYDEKNDDNYKRKKRDYYYKNIYRERSSRSPSKSNSRSRSRSGNRNYNRNIKKELNNDYRLNKKYKFVESIFRRSPSHKEEDNEQKDNNQNGNNNDNNNNDNNNEKTTFANLVSNTIKNNNNKEEINISNNNNNNNSNSKDTNKIDDNKKDNVIEEKNVNNKEKDENKEENSIKNSQKNNDEEHEEGSINE